MVSLQRVAETRRFAADRHAAAHQMIFDILSLAGAVFSLHVQSFC
jgi:hypothetical protein